MDAPGTEYERDLKQTKNLRSYLSSGDGVFVASGSVWKSSSGLGVGAGAEKQKIDPIYSFPEFRSEMYSRHT
jgi:hypothetical protein